MSLKVVFMGTPEFAIPTLDLLVQHHRVMTVVTSPDKPAGRGLNMNQSPVKQYALHHTLPVLQPLYLKDQTFLSQLKFLDADIFVVVAFRMLPEQVWKIPPHGTYNLHASLLPKYRGAAPINFAIINGEKETGVTTFKIQHQTDTGSIALQQKVIIDERDTAKKLHDKLMNTGAQLMLKTLNAIEHHQIELMPQQESEVSYAPKITKEFCYINWNNTSESIYHFIRGLSPYPAAYAYFSIHHKKTYCKILWAEKITEQHSYLPGKIITDQKKHIRVSTANGYIDIQQIQPEGKKPMHIEEFLRGNKITDTQCIPA